MKKLFILVGILALPGFLFFYVLPNVAKNRYHSLPYYGEKIVSGIVKKKIGKDRPDTLYHTLPDFKFTNQRAEEISWAQVGNSITFINLFDPNGNPGSLEVFKEFNLIIKAYDHNPRIQYLSISVDPLTTRMEAEKFIQQNHIKDGPRVQVMYADSALTYPFIRKGLLLDVVAVKQAEKAKYIYNTRMLMVDTKRHIRGFYDLNSKKDMDKLNDDIKVLIAEDLRNQSNIIK